MSAEQMEAGMAWVTERLSTIASEAGVSVQPVGWQPDTETQGFRHLLAVSVEGSRRVLAFTDSNLEDLPADDSVQSLIENNLRMFIRGERERLT